MNKNAFYYKIFSIIAIACLFFICFISRKDGFIILNSFHTYTLDITFQIITFLGDGKFAIALILVIFIFFKKYRNLAILLLFTFLLSGLFSQILKAVIKAPRPSVYFELHHYKFYLEAFTTCSKGFNSFPSGHTATSFAMATTFSIYLNKKYISIISLFTAFLIGYSRIYLANHFLLDVFAGAIIGIISGTFTIIWLEPVLSKMIKRIKRYYKPNLNWGNPFPNSPTSNG